MPTEEGLGTPRDFVQSGWDYFRGLGNQWILLSQQALGDLSALDVVPISFENATLDLNVDYGTFVRPVAPVVGELGDVNVTLPSTPVLLPITLRDIGTAPTEPDFSGLNYVQPAAPDDPMPTMPGNIDVVLDEIEIPLGPDYTLPTLPTLYALDLPAVPVIVLPEFDAARPVFNIPLPDSSFNWQEIAYSSTLLDAVKARLESMIDGGLGLPPEIEQALFDRGRGRADVLANKRVQERAETLAARGFVEGGSYIARALDEARTEGRAEAAGHNRDVTIRAAEIEVESIRFALTTAASLEATLLQVNGQINQRALEAAKISADIMINVFNALITRYNLDVEMFKADADVFVKRISAAIAVVELYKAQIEGQKAIGEVNESLIRAYVAQVGTVQALADIYRAQIEGAKARGEINTQRLDQARLRLQGFETQVNAWGKLQEGYKTQVDASLGNVRVFEAIGGVYGRRVDAWKTKGEAYFQEGRFQIEQQQLSYAGFNASLDGARTLITAQSASIDAKARTVQARAQVYQAEGAIAAAESAAQDRTAQLRVAVADTRLQAILKTTDARIAQNIQIASLYVEQLKAKAQVVSQLAAATLSGMNFGANYNGTLGVSTSYGVDFNYSGGTNDLQPPYVPYVSF